jgi:uridine kinase
MADSDRDRVLDEVANQIVSIRLPHPVRVAVDGIDAAGKTKFGDELAQVIRERGRRVIRASIDGFHRPKVERYRRGPESPAGYYHDSFNYDALKKALLQPLGQDGDLRYRSAIFDFRNDMPVNEPVQTANIDSVLLFDGVFLLRPELVSYWDFKIYLDVDFLVAILRACLRDKEFFANPSEVLTRLCKRYMAGNRLYLEEVRPWDLADVVLDNNARVTPICQPICHQNLESMPNVPHS